MASWVMEVFWQRNARDYIENTRNIANQSFPTDGKFSSHSISDYVEMNHFECSVAASFECMNICDDDAPHSCRQSDNLESRIVLQIISANDDEDEGLTCHQAFCMQIVYMLSN